MMHARKASWEGGIELSHDPLLTPCEHAREGKGLVRCIRICTLFQVLKMDFQALNSRTSHRNASILLTTKFSVKPLVFIF